MIKSLVGNIKIANIIVWLVVFIPIVDTMNGLLIKDFGIPGIGVFYRASVLILIFVYLYLSKCSVLEIGIFLVFILFLFVQYIVSNSYASDSIEQTIKLFAPIFMILTFQKMLRKHSIDLNSICKIFDWLALLFPLTIIIPYILGIGYSTYVNDVGYKAFYYATNEISFAVSAMVIYLWSQLESKITIKKSILIMLNGVSCILIGSKVAIAVCCCFVLLFIYRNLLPQSMKISKVRMFMAVTVVIGSVLILQSSGELLNKVIDRWMYNQRISENLLVFLTSHRVVFLENAYSLFTSKGLMTILLGWGLGGANNGMVNVEMDMFDLIFSCGVVGAIIIAIIYFILIKKSKIRTRIGWICIWISLGISFSGGHILFTGLGGMIFALISIYSMVYEKNKICEKSEKYG